MDDTTPQFTEKMIEMIRRKKPEERLAMGCSMFDFSKELVISSILKETPDISQGDLRKEIFLRFYGNDFEIEDQNKIIQHFFKK